jgi:hypothetical protein
MKVFLHPMIKRKKNAIYFSVNKITLNVWGVHLNFKVGVEESIVNASAV